MLVTEWKEPNVTKRNVAVVTHSQNHNYTHIVIRIRTRIHIRFHFLVFVILHALVVAHVNRIYIVLSPTDVDQTELCATRNSQVHSQHTHSGIHSIQVEFIRVLHALFKFG